VISPRRSSFFLRGLLRAVARFSAMASISLVAITANAAPAEPAPPNSDSAITLADYRTRLQSLDQLISNCQNSPSSAGCSSNLAGPDPKLSVAGGVRQVRLAWLRGLLEEAGKAKDGAAKAKAAAPKAKEKPATQDSSDDEDVEEDDVQVPSALPSITQQFQDAHQRIAKEIVWAAAPPPSPATSSQRQTLDSILAAREYHAAVAPPSIKDRLLEKLGNWLDRFFGKLAEAGSKSRWFGYAAEAAFGALVIGALVWFIIRLERQGRIGSGLHIDGPNAGAASARDWQLWLKDARSAAAAGAFRDAIHLLYWASISRLESSGQWPADRARTPREYLALLAPDNAQRPGLAAITRSFERTWYGGHSAAEADFLRAEQLAANLGAASGSKSGSRLEGR
jgi:Domain of unknown function (DUF4129)